MEISDKFFGWIPARGVGVLLSPRGRSNSYGFREKMWGRDNAILTMPYLKVLIVWFHKVSWPKTLYAQH